MKEIEIHYLAYEEQFRASVQDRLDHWDGVKNLQLQPVGLHLHNLIIRLN